MTYRDYLELRELARRRIAERVKALTPIAGRGVKIEGKTISLEPQTVDEAERRAALLAGGTRGLGVTIYIFMAVRWLQEGRDENGISYATAGGSDELRLAAIVDESGDQVQRIPGAWDDVWFFKAGVLQRQITVRFVARVFKAGEPLDADPAVFPFPIQLTIDVGEGAWTARVDTVIVSRPEGAFYQPKIVREYERYEPVISHVRRL